MDFTSLIVPLLLALTASVALIKKTDVFSALTDGASDGLKVVVKIIPSLIALLTAVSMFQASGAMDALTLLFSPALRALGIPEETAALILVRPVSGSGALAVGSEIISKFGPNSLEGRTAAVMLGSTETTFYTIAVYFTAAKIKKTRHVIPAALMADLTGFIAAAFAVRLFFY